MQDVLIVERENAFLSLDLATVIIDLEVGFSVDDAYISSSERFHLPSFIQFLAKMEFHSLLKKFG
jgi:5'-3' exonuclease